VDRRLWGPKQRGIFGALIHLVRALSIELKQSNDHTNNSYSGRKWKAARSCVLTTRLHAGDCFRLGSRVAHGGRLTMVELPKQQNPTCYTLAPHPIAQKTARAIIERLFRENFLNIKFN
jgi:hypothetical protein